MAATTYELVRAAMERGASMPIAARRRVARWSEKTRNTYLSEVRMAREWWEGERREAREAAAAAGLDVPQVESPQFMPWTPDRLASYVGHLAQTGKAPATISKALAALRAWHRIHGLSVPDSDQALTVLQDHEHNLARAGWEPRRAEPISLGVAARLLSACDRSTDRGVRDAALLMLGFGGMMSTAELAALNLGDVRIVRDAAGDVDALAVLRPVPDDDQDDGAGEAPTRTPVAVPHWRIAGEHAAVLCPPEAVAGWVGILDHHGAPPTSPLFRPIDRHGNIGGISRVYAGGAHVLHEGGRLGTSEIGAALRAVADRAGMTPDERPTMTELRLGGVVRRRLDGATVDELQDASGLRTLLAYIRAAEHRQEAT